jgi:uroporphyrinogen-III decarboxylase
LNRRERIIAALEGEEPDLVPLTDLGLDPPILDKLAERSTRGFRMVSAKLRARTESVGGIEWESSKRNLLQLIEACDVLGFDAAVIHGYSLLPYDHTSRVIDDDTIIDEWGRIQRWRADTKTTWWIGGTVKTREDLCTYEPPIPNEPGRYEMLQQAIQNANDDVAVIGCFPAGFVITWQVMGGIDRLILALHRDRGFAGKLRERVHRACTEWIKMMLDAGLDAFIVSDDYADAHGPFLGPSLFRDFELPFLRATVNAIRRRGIPVLKHSDGNLYPIIEDLIGTGIAGLHPIEPGIMDIAEVKRRYGDRICVMGNVDCRYILPYGSEAQVVEEVRRVIDMASVGGGHILTSSNSLHSNVKVENVFIMAREARKYGRYHC